MLDTIRHYEVFNPDEYNQQITIIGAGAIGSRVFAALAELGLTRITVYDFDKVEGHNLANQVYCTADIGKPKVEALKNWYLQKVGIEEVPEDMHFINEAVTAETEIKGTVFLLVDSMAARKQIFNENIDGNEYVYRTIDVRMASTHGNVLIFKHSHSDAWLNTLIDDDDAETSACGSSLTVGTTASILSNIAVWQYMHCKQDHAAVDDRINVFLKPLTIGTQAWGD